jgi:hypothetical protein
MLLAILLGNVVATLALILVIVAVTLVLVLVLLRLVRRLARMVGTGDGPGTGTGPPATIPDHLDGAAIAGYLTARLAGTPADGSAASGVSGTTPAEVVWVDGGDEVLVHLDGTSTQIVGQTVLVSIDLECDQTGRTPLVVAFALPSTQEAGLVVATDEYPRGNGLLASRWGPAVQAAAWSAMLTLADDHASERGLAPRGLAVTSGRLHLIAGSPLAIG